MTCDKWGILVPEATTNLVTNPSFETGTTGWAAAAGTGGTVTPTRVAAAARRGAYGVQLVITYGSAVNRYIMGTNGGTGAFTAAAGTSYTASIDFYTASLGSAAVTFYMSWFTSVPAFISNSAAVTITTAGAWTRASITATAPATTALGALVVSVDTAGITCYIDGAQVEAKTYATSYTDGDQGEGYAWTGTAHASTSTRTAQARSGGREYMIESGYGLTARYMSGIGMPPIRQLVQPRALLPGAHYSGYHVDPRAVTLLIAAANNASLSALHDMRALLINALKPDLVSPDDQPITLRYYGSNSTDPAELYCYYEAGLDFQQPEYYKFDQIPLRLIAYDPYWYKQGSRAASLSTSSSLNTTGIVGLVSGSWQALGGGVDLDTGGTAVYALARSADNGVFAGGKFGTAGSTANARSIAKWNPGSSTWSTMNGGVKKASVPGTIYGLQNMPDGSLYVGGFFNTAGSTAMTNFGKWTGSAWAAVGSSTAINSTVRAVAATTTGVLYIGGMFLNGGSIASADKLVQWNRSAYASVTPSGGPNDKVYAIAVSPVNGYVYIGGEFTSVNGAAGAYLQYFNGTAWATVGGVVPNNIIYAIAVAPNGDIYVGGDLSAMGTTTTGSVARFNGTAWESAVAGATPPGVRGLHFDEAGNLIITSTAGTFVYNGSTTSYVDFGTGTSGNAVLTDNYANLYVGFTGTASADVSGAATTVTNSGSARAYPVIKIKRSGGTTASLSYITNATTGKSLWFDYDLQDGETLTIDTRLGYRNITSDAFGQVWRALLRNSDFSEFYLQPGANTIRAYISTTGSPTLTATIEWREAHWSADTV